MREFEENDRILNNVEQRKLSHYERELIKSMEAEKQKLLKETLHWENKKRMAEDKLNARNMMKFNPEFFTEDVVLKSKNIFLNGGDF